MDKTLQEKIYDIIVDHLGVEMSKIEISSRFDEDLGADSLDRVELGMAIEEMFDITLPDDDITDINTVADFIALAVKHGAK